MFKVQEIREIIRLIDHSSITEFCYEHDGATLKIKKETEKTVQVVQEPVTVQKAEQQVQEQPKALDAQKQETPVKPKEEPKQTETKAAQVEDDANIVEIVSPMVGTFYRRPNPESDPYVEVGDVVKEDTVVCIVEAMKLFNEIEAEVSGEIVEVLVEDGTLVEYGQPLFKVKQK